MAIPSTLLQGIKRLDPLPATLTRLTRALDDDRVGAREIGEIVQFDQAAVAGILRVANSAAFGGWTRTESIRDAVTRLGKTRTINIVFGDHLKKIQTSAPLYDLSENELWLHAAAASIAVRAIARECPQAGLVESAAVAAVLHDIGKLIMTRYLKADYKDILAKRNEMNATFVEAERELFGCDHAEVGGEIARHWGFPDEIQTAIARHHEVPLAQSTTIIDAVVMANMVAKTVGTGLGAEGLDIRTDRGCRERLRLDFAKFSRVCLQTLGDLQQLHQTVDAKA